MDSNTFALTAVALVIATWFVYRVRKTVEGIECMHDQVHENGNNIDSIGFMLAIMMDALEIAHPKDEVPDAPDLSTLVDQWDNEN